MNWYMTVLGPISEYSLGHCQPHEHVYVDDTPAAIAFPQLKMDNVELSSEELKLYKKCGGQTIVDAQPVGAGRNVEQLVSLSRMSNVNIIASTGYHVPMFYDSNHWIHTSSEDELTILFGSELSEGMFVDGQKDWPKKRSESKAGIVKAAITADGLTDYTRRLLRAAGRAAAFYGVPLMLHTEAGKAAIEAVDVLNGVGLSSDRILVCHVDRQAHNLAPHLALAKKGVYLEYDTIGRFKYHDDASEIDLIREMIQAGHIDQILMSLDTTTARFKSYGGEIGLDYLINTFLPQLQSAGVSIDECIRMTRHNPIRALCYFI